MSEFHKAGEGIYLGICTSTIFIFTLVELMKCKSSKWKYFE